MPPKVQLKNTYKDRVMMYLERIKKEIIIRT